MPRAARPAPDDPVPCRSMGEPMAAAAPVSLSNDAHVARYPLAGGCRHAGVNRRVLEREATVRREREIDKRVDRVQVRRGDLVATLNQHIGQQLLIGRAAVLTGLDDGADHLVVERGDAARGPEVVVGTGAQEGRGRYARLPRQRIELRALEASDRIVVLIRHRHPGLHRESEQEESLLHERGLGDVLVALVVFAQAVGAGSERRADILQEVADHAPCRCR